MFGWQVQRWADQEYWLLLSGGEDGPPGIDGATAPAEDHGQSVVLTVGVDDLAAAVDRARAAGAEILFERRPIQGVGWLAQLRDRSGILIGMMEADESASRE